MKSIYFVLRSTNIRPAESDLCMNQIGYDPKSLKKLPFEGGTEPLGQVPDRPARGPGGCRGLSWSLIAKHQAFNR